MALAAAACVAGALLIGRSRAADHLDAPLASSDPTADITDVYAFTSPENPSNLVLVMNVAPLGGASQFSDKVDYAFRVRAVTGTSPLAFADAPLDVVCTFDAGTPQKATCTTATGIAATVAVDDTSGGGNAQSDMRVFAGKRSDPFFLDLPGLKATLANGKPQFSGTNTFDKQNVLSLVVEVSTKKAFYALPDAGIADGAVLAVSGQTVRRSP